jgi:hypothetical protein
MPRERGTSSALGPAESRPHALSRGAVEVIYFAGGISVRMAEELHNGAEELRGKVTATWRPNCTGSRAARPPNARGGGLRYWEELECF